MVAAGELYPDKKNEIKKLLKTLILLGLRNLYEPEKVKELCFVYEGVGRWQEKPYLKNR